VRFRDADFLGIFWGIFWGTFLPARRASDRPIAMACFRDVTFFPDRPLRSEPAFFSRIAAATFRPLALLYFRAIVASSDR
jgi:hypothetical protein